MIDIHMHTEFSSDSTEDMENYIKKAIEQGGKDAVIGFTEHFDFDYMYAGLNAKYVDFVGFFDKISRMRDKYKGQITILSGAEFGFVEDPNAQQLCNMIVDKYNLDYAINSIHIVDGEDLWGDAYFDKRSKHEAFGRYLEKVRESLDTLSKYQVVGHLGYCQRKATYEDKILYYSEFSEIIDDIFKTMIKKNIILEINTSTRGVCDLIPSMEMLKRYRELGGKLISFGSDAHQEYRMFDRYDYVCEVIKELGLDRFAYAEKQELKYYKIK